MRRKELAAIDDVHKKEVFRLLLFGKMPTWCNSWVIIRGRPDALTGFLREQCDDDGTLLFRLPSGVENTKENHLKFMGFDGFVSNGGVLHRGIRKILGVDADVLQADFETRWNPPVAYMEYLAAKHTALLFYMRYEREDEAPCPWFQCKGIVEVFGASTVFHAMKTYIVLFDDGVTEAQIHTVTEKVLVVVAPLILHTMFLSKDFQGR